MAVVPVIADLLVGQIADAARSALRARYFALIRGGMSTISAGQTTADSIGVPMLGLDVVALVEPGWIRGSTESYRSLERDPAERGGRP